MTQRPILTSSQRIRYVLYAIGVTVAVFAIADGLLTSAESTGAIDITRSDDQVSTLVGDPWTLNGDRYALTPTAQDSMVPMGFMAQKPELGYRAFLVGGSFMRGVPHNGAGTIRFWLYRELRRRYPTSPIEVINAGATSQNSHRVREVAKHAVTYSPDAMIIASCNNEGALPPGEVQKRLQRSGTFRLLKSFLRPEVTDSERPIHTPQDADIDAVRNAFRKNLTAMVKAAKERDVTVFLSTLPLNLRYDGNTPGRPISGREHSDQVKWPPCVSRGYSLYEAKDYQGAIRALSTCDEVEALRWIGLSRYALGDFEKARAILRQYTELEPRNRCRPSFQQVIRDVAKAETVPLIDLEAAINNASPNGLPGPELFASYCHMTWQGQAIVADTMMKALQATKAVPQSQPMEAPREDRAQVFQSFSKEPAAKSYYF